ncbi:MAG: Ig-like domain repeat protein [Bacteroidaceae bacterium]|nr:Ig-like domain repeat protein [Bacteroidaceae bacterium]
MEFRIFTQDPTPDSEAAVALDLTKLGFTAEQECRITEMWKGIDMGTFKGSDFAPTLRSHASGLYRVTPLGRTEGASVSLSCTEQDAANKELQINVSDASTEGGYVQLLCNGKVLSVQALKADGSATYDYSDLYAGSYTFQALYSGTTTTASATSEELTITVEGEAEDLSGLQSRLNLLVEEAKTVDPVTVAGVLRTPLAKAIEEAQPVEGKDKAALETAITNLQEALDAARLSISSMNALQSAIDEATSFINMLADNEGKTALEAGINKATQVHTAEASTLDDIKQAATELLTLVSTTKKTAQPIEGACIEMTEFLVNPSFENKTTGWSVAKQVSGWESFDTWSDRPAVDGTFFVSLCYQDITSIDMYQNISGLQAGTYTIKASLRNTDGADFLTDQRIYAEAGNNLYESDKLTTVSGDNNNDWTTFTLSDVTLEEGETLRLGARSTGTGSSTKGWFQADDFRLYYWGKKVVDGIENATADEASHPNVTATDGGILVQIAQAEEIAVYGLDGALVKKTRLTAGTHFMPLSTGKYIVGGQVVIVK